MTHFPEMLTFLLTSNEFECEDEFLNKTTLKKYNIENFNEFPMTILKLDARG